jgi:hypothetical protein
MANHYAVGAVKSWVQTAADEVGNRFNVATIYGVGSREIANSDHPKGLALDFMTGTDYVKGDQIASFMQANWHVYSVQYIIWKQHIWNESRSSEGWRPMPDRGSLTANHFDHVHVSFQANGRINMTGGEIKGGGINIPNPIDAVKQTVDGIKSTVDALNNVGEFVTNGHNWVRVGSVALGALMVVLALIMLGAGGNLSQAAGSVVKTASKVKGVKNG